MGHDDEEDEVNESQRIQMEEEEEENVCEEDAQNMDADDEEHKANSVISVENNPRVIEIRNRRLAMRKTMSSEYHDLLEYAANHRDWTKSSIQHTRQLIKQFIEQLQ